MKILICGGRDFARKPARFHGNQNMDVEWIKYWDEQEFLEEVLESKIDTLQDELCAGGAKGADTAAYDWATKKRVPCKVYPADWDTHGRSAGSIRNQLMLYDFKPDLVIAFPGGRGTADMVRKARYAGVDVFEVKYDNGA